jgi:hypothetical protein
LFVLLKTRAVDCFFTMTRTKIFWAACALVLVGVAISLFGNREHVKERLAVLQRPDTEGARSAEARAAVSMEDLPRRLADSSFFRVAFSSEQTRAEFLLKAFRTRYLGTGQDGGAVLDAVHAVGLAPSAQNVKAVRAALSQTSNPRERVGLIRLLGSLHSQLEDAGERQALLEDLRQLSASDDVEVRRSAVLAYSRLGFFPDSLKMLAEARAAESIGPDDYHMELAHMLPLATDSAQFEIVRDLASGGSPLSRDIVASSLMSPDYASSIPKAVAREVFTMLAENEPVFSGDPQAYGLSDAIRYAEWLHGMANLHHALTGETQQSFLQRRLLDDGADPRKLVAAAQLTNFDGGLSQALGADASGRVTARLNRFAAANAGQSFLSEATSSALQRLQAK